VSIVWQENRLLCDLSTFNIGGPAHYYVEARSAADLISILETCRQKSFPYFILGKGSNCLFDDRGFAGVVIANKLDGIKEISPGRFYAAAGASFSLLGARTAREGWSGLEFASGIPASVGGAIYMNAGAMGRETCQALRSVEYLTHEGEVKNFAREELSFAYRSSPFQKQKGVILGATFFLEKKALAREYQIEIVQKRAQSQPYQEKSAGCVFRNPEGAFAGALIEKAGLKGARIGDAVVSAVHANFIVNSGKARASDVLQLIDQIQKQVQTSFGIFLHPEVRYIPYESLAC
jgi:UDP-N-acetylmuramate dehydrogenase